MANKTKKNGSNVVDVSALLANHATEGKPKKKTVPELEGYGDLADTTYEAYKAMKDAEATFKSLEGEILEITSKEYETRATTGNFTKSLNVVGRETAGVQAVYKDQFSAMPNSEKPRLQEALGEKYDQYFEEKRELTLKDTSDTTIKLLLEKLGKETFCEIFEIKLSIVTKPDMDQHQFELPEDVRPKQYKPGLRLIGEK
jgi:hypothetical protein